MQKLIGMPVLLALLALGWTDTSVALTFTCDTVALDREADPSAAVFGKRFESVRINLQGDVVFIAHPKRGPRRLYLYPGAGAASVIASAGDSAPGGSTFKRFRAPSINDAGDVGFISDLQGGEGVYVRDGGGGIVKAAKDGDAAPGGDFFNQFLALSRINADGDLAFVAELDTGETGVFFYDGITTSVFAVARAGDATGDGRQFCEFSEVGLGNGAAAFETVVKTDCSMPDPEVSGLWRTALLGFVAVAEEGGTAPNGALYESFLGAPDLNAADKVLFRADTFGGVEINLFDPAGPSTTELVAAGDPAPDLNPVLDDGVFTTVAFGSLTNGDRAAIGVRIRGGEGFAARGGVFVYGGTPDKVVVDTDDPPAPFAAGSEYGKIDPGAQRPQEEIGNDRSGTRVVFGATVRSAEQPRGRAGIFRCAGS